jgi:phosphoadenylyl-sulfate reductase (thioredoxin)
MENYQDLENLEPEEIIKWAIEKYHKIAVSTSFGKDSMVIMHMALKIKPDIPMFTLNTGYEFSETLEFMEKIVSEWNLNFREYTPDISILELEEKYGKDFYLKDPGTCCTLLKVNPTKKALVGLNAWITGLRRDETEFRKTIGILEEFEGADIVKINPLANWTEDQIWDYIRKNDIPYNPLYDKGFRSLGCEPCSRAGKLGQFERAGRWTGTEKEGGECGIHTFLKPKNPEEMRT